MILFTKLSEAVTSSTLPILLVLSAILYFQNVNGMRQNALLHLLVSNGNSTPCTVEIREGSPFGAVLGCCKVGNTGGFEQFTEVSCRLENTHGTHGLCFVFRGEEEELLRFESFRFEQIRP